MTGRFYRGLEVIVDGGENIAVLPVFLGNLWGSRFSYAHRTLSRRQSRGLRRTVVVVFGPPVAVPITTFAVRQAVLEAGVTACEGLDQRQPPLETLDRTLPHLDHPELGPLTGSTADYDQEGIRQTGHKPGTVGHPLPGVAFRVVDERGNIQGADVRGRLLARVPGRDWMDTGHSGSLDRDGFVMILE